MQATIPDHQQLPVPSTSFIGRTDELARITGLLARPNVRLVTLTGPGGVGKTRLVLEIARAIDPAVAGAIHLVVLTSSIDADSALLAMARALGVTPVDGVPLERRIADTIDDRPLLLILDNAEQVADHLTVLSAWIARCPNLKVLVTSRIMLRLSAEHVVPVEPLHATSSTPGALSPATALFVERGRAVRPDLSVEPEDLRAIDAICQQVDGLPLAIELAAARTRFLTPIALRDRLTRRLNVLVGGPRDVPERHQTLRATLTWSHDLLTTEERVLFRRLAVFRNGCPWDAVVPVCNAWGDLGDDVEAVLAELVDHSLVRIVSTDGTGPRVRMLHTIREFAREQLELSGELEPVRDAHAAWFTALMNATPEDTWRTGTPELREWTRRHDPDLENLQLALERLAAQGDSEALVHMVSGMINLWAEFGRIHEAVTWSRRALPMIDLASPDVQASLLFKASAVESAVESWDTAVALCERAIAVARERGDHRMEANAINLLGTIHWDMGDPVEGERLQQLAIALVTAKDDPLGGALFQARMAIDLVGVGEYDRAETILQEALPRIWRVREDAARQVEGTLAHLRIKRGDFDAARASLETSIEYHRPPPHRNPFILSERLRDAATLALRDARPLDAARLLGVARALMDRVGFADNAAIRQEFAQGEDALRAMLDRDTVAASIAAGRMMSLPAGIDLALDVARLRSDDPDTAPASTSSAQDGLTPRQREVLRLLAEGRSNADIAEALFISERTVTTHLTRIYDALGVSTRGQAIALANRLRLAPDDPV